MLQLVQLVSTFLDVSSTFLGLKLPFQVVASDPDPGPIGEVSYRVTTEFDDAGSFAVDAESGAVSVASRLDFDARSV